VPFERRSRERAARGDQLTLSDGTGRVAPRPAGSRDRRVPLDHEPREPGQVRKEAAVAGIRLRAGVPCDPGSPRGEDPYQ